MKLTYDEDSDTLYVNLILGQEAVTSQQVGNFVFDLNANGDIIGFDINQASKQINLIHKLIN